MNISTITLTTGISSLDKMLQGLSPGDNIVWQIGAIDDYIPFVLPFCEKAIRAGRQVIYFRFARHAPLLDEREGLKIHSLDTAGGFETFIADIHSVIENNGRDAVYVFDCLSDLAVDWNSDRMLGNFFLLTCPYIRDHGAMAYFGLTRHAHSFHALDPVRDTTQILINVCRYNGELYIQPLKVEHRHSRTMYMLHVQKKEEFEPVIQSATIARVVEAEYGAGLGSGDWRLGYWGSTFAEAEEMLAADGKGKEQIEARKHMAQKLRRMLIARDGRLLELAGAYLDLPDLIAVRRRMIGTGLIGGKAAGMLIAQAVLQKSAPELAAMLEPHDSFFIGADVFYTYLVQNGLWWIKHQQKNPKIFLEGVELAHHQILNGRFPDYIIKQFTQLLEYYGQSPMIVRSSSLLEDDFDASFAGKSESILCTNQGSFDKRLSEFLSAIRQVYASTMSDVSLKYRAARGILHKDEQMAILVQRVSGAVHGPRFFPHVAGVGLSFNPYAWSERVDPHAGVLRLVFGLGTRAVTPHPEDYTRVIALNAPKLQIQNENEDAPYAQQKVDVLDLDTERVVSEDLQVVGTQANDLPIHLFATQDERLMRLKRERNLKDIFPWALTFDTLLTDTTFVDRMRHALSVLETAYGTPVDIEFAANFADAESYQINLLQCRPLHAHGGGPGTDPTYDIDEHAPILLKSTGPVLGQSRSIAIDRVIYVASEIYGALPVRDRYAVARLIGDLMRLDENRTPNIMLVGPGRWGTADPALGIPVSFAELHGATVICEVSIMHEGLTPDVSLGSHFFNELIETDILYFALTPNGDAFVDDATLLAAPNRLTELLPEKDKWAQVIRVLEPDAEDAQFRFWANTAKQLALLARQ